MRVAARTDRGLVRQKNEDGFLAENNILAVADGMGGHEAGELASQIALREVGRGHGGRAVKVLRQAFQNANAAVNAEAARRRGQGMGTTLTVALVNGARAWIGHVGDSRAYLLRENKLTQLTDDHSLVAGLVRSGQLSKLEARTHPRKNIITKAVGGEKTVDPDIFEIELLPGDRLILCTDGLTNEVEEDQIAKLGGTGGIDTASRALIDAALRAGGRDNVTVVVGEFEGAPATSSRPVARRRRLLGLLALIAVAAIGFMILKNQLNQTFYLASSGKRVEIWRGWPTSVGGFKLGRFERKTGLQVNKLPAYYRRRLKTGLVVGDQAALNKTLIDLEEMAN